jgi:hypothetical protein
MDNITDKIIKKSLKSYLKGKELYNNNDKKNALECFKKSLLLLNEVKHDNKYNDILIETENECNKYLTLETTTIHNTEINNEIEHNLFHLIKTGNLNQIKKININKEKFKEYNEEGLTILHYAVKYSDISCLKYLLSLYGSSIDEVDNNGHTLLEYACLSNDPNMEKFLQLYGANIKKHIDFRNGTRKYKLNVNKIDIALLLKYVLLNYEKNNNNLLNFTLEYIDKNTLIGLDNITFYEFLLHLNDLVYKLNNDSKKSYIDILKEELQDEILNKYECPNNKIEIILYNLYPFINYGYNLSLYWLISLEIKYIINNIIKNKNINDINLIKNNVYEKLKKDYIDKYLIPNGIFDIIISRWLNKIN